MHTLEFLAGAVPCGNDPHDVLRYALRHMSAPGMVCEFGVAAGTTLSLIVKEVPDRRVIGFDSFDGLPQDWRPGFPAGTFAQATPPHVEGAELQIGMFSDTLPAFLGSTEGPIAFIHIDCDLYSSTATVLELVYSRLTEGTVIVFDEFVNYPGWAEHEYRAWSEFVAATGLAFNYLAYAVNGEQVAVIVAGVN